MLVRFCIQSIFLKKLFSWNLIIYNLRPDIIMIRLFNDFWSKLNPDFLAGNEN